MKSTGIVRKVDNLGRFVLPIELRRMFEIAPDDNLEIFIDKNIIILKKYMPDCMVCGETKNDMILLAAPKWLLWPFWLLCPIFERASMPVSLRTFVPIFVLPAGIRGPLPIFPPPAFPFPALEVLFIMVRAAIITAIMPRPCPSGSPVMAGLRPILEIRLSAFRATRAIPTTSRHHGRTYMPEGMVAKAERISLRNRTLSTIMAIMEA